MIEQLFEILIIKSVGITILLLTILLLRTSILKWSNARVAYGLWLMLPLYLVLPINIVDANPAGGIMTFFLSSTPLTIPFVDKGLITSSDIAVVCMSLWLLGAVVALLLFLLKYQKLKQSLHSLDRSVLCVEIESGAQVINKQALNKVQLVASRLINVPAVFGLFKSYLALPANFAQLPAQSQTMILEHELFHLSRQDHRINFLRMFIKSIFWFNPIFYWADKFCEADQEISCDLGVLQYKESKNRLIYAKVLLESMAMNNMDNNRNKLVSQWKYQSLVKERVKMLKNIRCKKWHSWVATVFAASAMWGTSSLVMAEKKSVDAGATPISIVQPRYPMKAVKERVEGWVKLRFNIDSEGFPYEVAVIDDMPKGVFVEDAVKAVRQWRFKTDSGQDDLIYTMEFKLADE